MSHHSINAASGNALIALAILLAVWQACEWRIRRRAAQKADVQSRRDD